MVLIFGARMRVGLAALTIAEYFRDVNEQDVMLMNKTYFYLSTISFDSSKQDPKYLPY